MSDFFDIIWYILILPVKIWRGGCETGSESMTEWGERYCTGGGSYQEPDKFIAVIFGLLIYGLLLLVCSFIFGWISSQVKWRMQRGRCQHCETWTRNESDGSAHDCLAGHPCCEKCIELHRDEEVQRRADQEPRVTCASCSTVMDKEIHKRIIIDVCPHCGAVFLSREEMAEIKKLADKAGYNRGYSDGKSSGSSSGMIIGMAVGTSIG